MPELIETFVQTLLAFFSIFFYSRILGKQQISQLTFYEYINGITFGSIAATLATDVNQRTLTHFIGLTLFFLLTYVLSYTTLKSRPLRKLIEGEPTVIIHNGKVLEENMSKMRYNFDQLNEQLREKSVFNIEDVEFAIAETDGALSILLKTQKQPVTPKDLQLSTQYQGISSELIVDGQVINQNLKQNNLDMEWLTDELGKQGVFSLHQVAFAVLGSNGKLYIDRIEDNLTYKTNITD